MNPLERPFQPGTEGVFFSYTGSVDKGTTIYYGSDFSFRVKISAAQCASLLKHFRGKTANVGTSRDNAPRGSLGEWLQLNVTKTATASYVAPILIAEGYAERAGGPNIRFR